MLLVLIYELIFKLIILRLWLSLIKMYTRFMLIKGFKRRIRLLFLII
jgi:hypothetical protein